MSNLLPYFRQWAAFLIATIACNSFAFGGEIHDAAAAGNVAKVKSMLQTNAALILSKDPNGWTPLHFAARNIRIGVATLLLSSNAPVNERNNAGMTPLLSAVSFNNSEDMAELLLTNQADLKIKDNNGLTALHYAAGTGVKATVELLIANKAEVNAKDNFGRTPLHRAAMNGHTEVIPLLLAHRANPYALDNDGKTPLDLAKANGMSAAVEMLQPVTPDNTGLN